MTRVQLRAAGVVAVAVLLIGGLVALAADDPYRLPRTTMQFAPQSDASLFVAPEGSDVSDCTTRSAPCRTFDRAYHVAGPGAVIEVAGGEYPPQLFSEDPSKTSPDDVVVRAAAGAKVVVGCDGPDNCLATEGADHLTVSGIATAMLPPVGGKPRQGGVAIDRGSEDVTFHELDAGHIWLAGKSSAVIGGDYGPTVDAVSKTSEDSGPDILIDGASFHDFVSDTQHMECIAVHGARGLVIRRSRFDTCEVFAIFSTPEVGQHFRDVLIENNFFSNSGGIGMSAHIKVGSHGGDCSSWLIRNNSFVDDNVISDCGLDEGSATGIRWIGNLFEQFDGGGCAGGHSFDFNVIEEGSGCGAHDVVVGAGRAGFADRGGRDLHLRRGSPAVDRASPHDHPPTDIDGNPRPAGSAPDAGADEFGSEGGTPPSRAGVGRDVAAPRLTVRAPRRMMLRRRLRFRIGCSEPCRIAARLVAARPVARRLGLGRRTTVVGRGRARLLAAGTARVTVALTRRAGPRLLAQGRVRVALRTRATDFAGNARARTRRVTLQR